MPNELKNTEIFESFQRRKQILDRACSVSRKVVESRKLSHEERIDLQNKITKVDEKLPESKLCVPRLADKTQKQGKLNQITDKKVFKISCW